MPVIENNYEEVKNVHIISTSKNEEKKKKKPKKPDLWFALFKWTFTALIYEWSLIYVVIK